MMSIPRSTRALMDLCPELAPNPQKTLDIASFQATLAQSLGCGYLHDHWVACEQARSAGLSTVHHADHLPPETYPYIFLDARELDPALAAEFVTESAARLSPDGVLCTTARRTDVEICFESVQDRGEVLLARSPKPIPESARQFSYPLVFGEHTFTIQAEPGVFSPRGLDPGTREMLALIQAEPGMRFLDLGCGAGGVSLVAARVWSCQVTAVDVSARALRLTRQNVPEAEVIASDGFAALNGRQFDLIASNPPYHTDFAVAKRFIEGAFEHLSTGGRLYLVVKRADWYVRKVRETFGGCRVHEREGYAILSAEKREIAPKPERLPQAKTTKKHMKRVASSRSGKR